MFKLLDKYIKQRFGPEAFVTCTIDIDNGKLLSYYLPPYSGIKEITITDKEWEEFIQKQKNKEDEKGF